MPRVALIALLMFGALAFGWRSFVQYRRSASPCSTRRAFAPSASLST